MNMYASHTSFIFKNIVLKLINNIKKKIQIV